MTSNTGPVLFEQRQTENKLRRLLFRVVPARRRKTDVAVSNRNRRGLLKVVAGGSVFVGQKRNGGTRWSEMVTESGGGSDLEVCDEENRDRD
jgi:hypothetical protein